MGDLDPIGIRELRQHASRYVDMAESGRRVPVTKRGKLVAYLVPAEAPTSMFEQLVAAGHARLARGRMRDALRELRPLHAEPGEKTLSETLREMRDEERY
ncbi:MAG: hypothetical protein QOI16_2412 [Pseudonocardiales bacterium]|jgi:prevent-host-death family protein|nr:hypothetical protein [Pseudonocardiales bacterium]